MMSKILVGVDGSTYAEKAFEYAVSLAQRFGPSRLFIVNIIEEFSTVGQSILKELANERQKMLQRYLTMARSAKLESVDIVEDKGSSAAEKILQIALSENVDTIVVGSGGINFPSEEFILGSTSFKVAHHAKCTVIIVR
jgi:nucleotide-binding universal stress UspA family protein